jgi:galactokinase
MPSPRNLSYPIERQLERAVADPSHPTFRASPPPIIKSAPGRIDLLGGLAREVGGTVAHMSLPARAAVAVQAQSGRMVHIHGPLGETNIPTEKIWADGKLRLLSELTILPRAQPVVAVIYALYQSAKIPAMLDGLSLQWQSQLAEHIAQGTQTALYTAIASALVELYRIKFEQEDLALLIQRAQGLFAPTDAHVIDALTCLHALPGPPSHVLRYSARPHELVGQITLPRGLQVWALNTGIRCGGVSTVESLRLAGAMGLRIAETVYKDLGRQSTPLRGALTNLSPALYRRYFRSLLPRRMRGADFLRTFGQLPSPAGTIDPARLYRVRTAVDHLLSENEHAEHFLQALEDLTDPGNHDTPAQRQRTCLRAGRLLLASHHSYRLRLELSTPEADFLVDRLMQAGPGFFGARITGPGGGGTVVALAARSKKSQETLLTVISEYKKRTGMALKVSEAGIAGSAGSAVDIP